MPILKIQPEWTLGENSIQAENFKLSNGINGNLETVEIMRQVARDRSRYPAVRELALKILLWHKIPSRNYLDESKAIGRFVKKKVRYVRDITSVETLHDPLTMIDQIKAGTAQGDCDDISLLIVTLLLSIGHQPFFRIIKYKDGLRDTYQHIYVVDYEKNGSGKRERLVMDGIVKDKPIGYEIKHLQGIEIKV